MKLPPIILSFLLLLIGSTAITAEELTTRSSSEWYNFFQKNPPIRFYQKKFLILSSFTLENTSNETLTASIYVYDDGEWKYTESAILGPYCKESTGFFFISIGIGRGVIKIKVKGYSRSLYLQFSGGDLQRTWYDE